MLGFDRRPSSKISGNWRKFRIWRNAGRQDTPASAGRKLATRHPETSLTGSRKLLPRAFLQIQLEKLHVNRSLAILESAVCCTDSALA